MSGGDQWYVIYHDQRHGVDIKVNFYQKKALAEATKTLLDQLEVKEPRLIECTSQRQESLGFFHCVRHTYPNALTLQQYKALLQGKPYQQHPRRKMDIPAPNATLHISSSDLPNLNARYSNMDEVLAAPNVHVF